MIEFKLCEEMGLKIWPANSFKPLEDLVSAKDVEKMLQGGQRQIPFTINDHGKLVKCESITLSIPHKPKPVSKSEIKNFLTPKDYPTSPELDYMEAKKLIERIEKHGIE